MNSTTTNTSYIKTCYAFNEREELIVAFPSKNNIYVHTFVLVVSIVFFLPTIFLNAVAVTTILKSRVMREKVSNFTIMAKSVIDLAIGLLIYPLFLNQLASEIRGSPSCVVFIISKKAGVFAYICSATTLSTMNYERYMGIFRPMRHRIEVTKTRLLQYNIAICSCQTILFSFAMNYVDIFPFILMVITFSLVLSTVFVYTSILLSRCKNQTHLGNQVSTLSRSTEKSRKQRFKKELDAAKLCFLVIVCCLACFLPGFISNMGRRLTANPSFSVVARRRYFALLFLSNSMLNPVIFFWKNKKLKSEGVNLIKSIYSR